MSALPEFSLSSAVGSDSAGASVRVSVSSSVISSVIASVVAEDSFFDDESLSFPQPARAAAVSYNTSPSPRDS